jgi:hypothetical protein
MNHFYYIIKPLSTFEHKNTFRLLLNNKEINRDRNRTLSLTEPGNKSNTISPAT